MAGDHTLGWSRRRLSPQARRTRQAGARRGVRWERAGPRAEPPAAIRGAHVPGGRAPARERPVAPPSPRARRPSGGRRCSRLRHVGAFRQRVEDVGEAGAGQAVLAFVHEERPGTAPGEHSVQRPGRLWRATGEHSCQEARARRGQTPRRRCLLAVEYESGQPSVATLVATGCRAHPCRRGARDGPQIQFATRMTEHAGRRTGHHRHSYGRPGQTRTAFCRPRPCLDVCPRKSTSCEVVEIAYSRLL